MNKYLAILLVLAAFEAQSLEVNNFKFGLMCGINHQENGWVCLEADNIHITGQSSCSIQGRQHKCTWYGFQFNYRNYEKGTKLKCTFSQSLNIKHVNLDGDDRKTDNTQQFEFELPQESGMFINPQYSLLGTANSNANVNYTEVSCNYKGKEVFEYKYNTILPTHPD